MSDKSRKHCSLLLIANIAVMVAAAGRQNPRNIPVRATPRPTRTKGAHGLTSLQVSHRPTKAPDLAASANLRRRQADPAICGYFPFHIENPLQCSDGYICTNIGGIRDCCAPEYCAAIAAFSTQCVDWDHQACQTNTPGTLCCNPDEGSPFCNTYLYSTTATPDQSFTVLICEDVKLKGFGTVYPDPRTSPISRPTLSTSAPVSSSQTSTSTSSTTSSATSTSSPGNQSSAPVGVIVGGVIGGLTVVGLVVLGVFFMFFRSRRKPVKSDGSEASMTFINHPASPRPSTVSPPGYGFAPGYSHGAIHPDPDELASHHQGGVLHEMNEEQRRPLMMVPPVEICENPRAGPGKVGVYTELPSEIYKSELPS